MGQECGHLLARQRSDDIVRLIGLDADSALIKLTVQLLKSQSPTWFKSGTLQQGCHLVVQNTLSIKIDHKKCLIPQFPAQLLVLLTLLTGENQQSFHVDALSCCPSLLAMVSTRLLWSGKGL